ncbi:hypothetical protein CHS0354_032752 [Potamilus streckersoni]|uniref:Protein amnionless n=1 Tax=Potamilus streckersoni TaxID=2493646 RepID=A0AAE0TJL7_9BIVA|nr:hypothetical protein CHS0354_032752 [Potamilus streckersoni]
MDKALIRLVLCFTFVSVTECLIYKKWLPNTNLDNPSNWNLGRLPCGNDRLVIPDESPVVFYQLNTTIRELVLAKDGEFVLGAYSTLAFTEEPDHSASCLGSGADVEFNITRPADWIDPLNWCQTSSESGSCDDVALLDNERVPCVTDNVIFPTGSSYYVNLGSNLDISINTIKVSGKAYSTATFDTFLNSEYGKKIFFPLTGNRSRVTIRRSQCMDVTGCACGNEQGGLLDAICALQSPRCARPRCKIAFRPTGSCCDMCGGIFNLTYGSGFNLETLRTGIKRNFLDGKAEYQGVSLFVSKITDGNVQMVLWDSQGGKLSSAVAHSVKVELDRDIKDGGFGYGINKFTLKTSDDQTEPTAGGLSGTNNESGLPQSTIIAIAVGGGAGLMLLLLVAFLIYRRRTRPSFEGDAGYQIFDRFSLRNIRKPRVVLPASLAFSWSTPPPENVGYSQGFDNPIYGSAPLEQPKAFELELTSTALSESAEQQPTSDHGFDNPLYGDMQVSMFSDPTQVQEEKIDDDVAGMGEYKNYSIA